MHAIKKSCVYGEFAAGAENPQWTWRISPRLLRARGGRGPRVGRIYVRLGRYIYNIYYIGFVPTWHTHIIYQLYSMTVSCLRRVITAVSLNRDILSTLPTYNRFKSNYPWTCGSWRACKSPRVMFTIRILQLNAIYAARRCTDHNECRMTEFG